MGSVGMRVRRLGVFERDEPRVDARYEARVQEAEPLVGYGVRVRVRVGDAG